MATATAEARGRPVVIEESLAARILRVLGKAPIHVILVVVGLFWIVPSIGLFAISIMSSLTTTIYIAIGGTVLPIFIASLAGYAFAWLDFWGRDWFFILVIALLVVPLQMALIPMFEIYNNLGIFDTVISIALFHTAFGLPFAIFLLRNFFIGIPKELLEAARIDGASELRIFFRLILPLGLPAIASLAIFQFLWSWNDLLVALTFGRETQPITVAIFSQLRQFGANIELIAPATFVSLVIPLGVFFAFQRYFVQGLLAGSVK